MPNPNDPNDSRDCAGPDRPERPFWTVIGVFDPDGDGSDFSYTVGLADRDIPELHLWARPTDGVDPAPDWAFSPRDRGMLLNELARDLLDGRLTIGDEFTREYDAGGATVTFRLDPPTTPTALDAFQASPDAQVIPVRWSLTRAPEGELAPVAPDAVADATRRLRELVGDADLDPLAAFDPDQAYGPLTPIVLAQAARVTAASVDELAAWCHNALLADDAVGPRHVLALAAAAARPVGRTAALSEVTTAAHAVVDALADPAADDSRFTQLVDIVAGETLMPGPERDQFAGSVRHLLAMAVAALLTTTAVIDVAGEDLERAGLGPWTWALTDTFTAPDSRWHATDTQLGRVRSALDAKGPLPLLALAQAHLTALEGDEYANVARWLRAQQLTTQAALPALAAVLPATVEQNLAVSAGPDAVDDVTDVVAVLVAATARRDYLHDAGAAALVAALAPACPGVRDLFARP